MSDDTGGITAAPRYVLEAKGLCRSFGGFRAVDELNLSVKEGSVHALIGPNGAGKTTVFNLLTKFLPVSAGAIYFRGRDITKSGPADVARLGVVRSFQISATFGQLTAFENVRIALQGKQGLGWHLAFPRNAFRTERTHLGTSGNGRACACGIHCSKRAAVRPQTRTRTCDDARAGA